ncbi:MAG TPA: hypothetical protein VK480_06120 [Solirubrobacterales bacterium]|nr:hypothetical protein [Solirubrobacterales bacterium]
MKYSKTLVLVALSMAALLASTSIASATTLTQAPSYEGAIHAESEGTVVIHGPDTAICKSTIEGTVNPTGGEGTVGGEVKKLTFEECGSNDVIVQLPGELAIHTQGASSNGNGTVTSTVAVIEIKFTQVGLTCIYSTTNTDIGTLTGSRNTGGTAKIDVEAALPRTGGSGGIFCGSTAQWTASYKITTPDYLDVD